jgi:transposase
VITAPRTVVSKSSDFSVRPLELPRFRGHLERPGMILSGEEVFMSAKRRQFTREFKLEAVRLVKKGNSVSSVAAQLGIRPDMLRHWKQQVEGSELARTEVFPGHGKVVSSEQELRRLRRELERVTQERDFLKKAAAYFAKEQS